MRIKLLVDNPRLNEMAGVLLLLLALGVLLCLVSYSPGDPSANVATSEPLANNWMGLPGSYTADFILQSLGLTGFLVPAWLGFAAWSRIRSIRADHMRRRTAGVVLLALVLCCTLQLVSVPIEEVMPPNWDATIRPGGALGKVLTDVSTSLLNIGGTILLLVACTSVGVYMLTSKRVADVFGRADERASSGQWHEAEPQAEDGYRGDATVIPVSTQFDDAHSMEAAVPDGIPDEIPRHATVESEAPPIVPYNDPAGDSTIGSTLGSTIDRGESGASRSLSRKTATAKPRYKLPEASLLNPPFAREPYDEMHLQETAQQIVEKFEEFGVRGSVNQINPGPVVTTFEFKPDRGVKYSKIVNLSEDLCLALECESVLVERIPGRPTVGIEVPNKKREVISLREVVDSPSFRQSKSMLTFALGKDINGRIHCADLGDMPHLLVAGQTGSGKSVMVNCVIMSLLLRATPEEVRLILVDPKTVELSLYRDVPHLLTPVITDMKMATNALKNATHEMERRLQLLAQYGVRNIRQFNDKVAAGKKPWGSASRTEEVEKLPYIVVIVDELADLMMLAGRQVEESIQRLAQMARAVGIHLMLATQRPSVDIITGLIKANIPARLSFLLATRVDSRTILDSMGAESLLGKGDMLFLPPGSARRRRLHGPLVLEDEIQAVVTHWKELAEPSYEHEYLEPPAGEQDDSGGDGEAEFDDPMYKEAVQLVLELGKASTSTLQRRLRLGYGRAARILDAMERDGIIGPPDGSRPREVLKRPDWLDEVGAARD